MAKKNVQAEKKQRQKALQGAVKKIHRKYGNGAIMRFSDDPNAKVERISTGLLSLDYATGGGLPRGRVLEFYGRPSGGKSTLALTCVAAAQKQGLTCAYIDAENALDPTYAKNLGVNIDNLLISQPGSGEQGLNICDALVSSGAVGLVVVDSVAALTPEAEIQGEMGDQHVGVQARMMSQGLRKLSNSISKTNTIVIFINQIREKVGVMFGNPETTPGGKALKFYDSIRIQLYPGQKIKQGGNVIGSKAKMKITKNKVAPPYKRCQIDMYYGHGYSKAGDLLNMAEGTKDENGNPIVEKAGAWYSALGTRIGQGKANTEKFLDKHPDISNKIEYKVRKAYKMPVPDSLKKALANQNHPNATADSPVNSTKKDTTKKANSKNKPKTSKK